MKIRDIKGIVEKLPEVKPEVDDISWGHSNYEINDKRNETIDTILNTDINLEDIVELDVDRMRKVIGELLGGYHDPIIKDIATAIAKAGILKWKNI